MEVLKFYTPLGACGLTCEWDADGAVFDADGWLLEYGENIGSNFVARLPDAHGYIDLSQFAYVKKID